MFEIQKFNNEPQFGLMTRSDKEKLDALISASDTFATKAEINNLSDTYATKRNTLAQIIASDTGFIFLNGVGEIVGSIPVLIATKADPQLSVEPANPEPNIEWTFNVSRLGEGSISVEFLENEDEQRTGENFYAHLEYAVDGNTITVNIENRSIAQGLLNEGDYTFMSVSVAETEDYESATTTVTLIASGEVEG